MPADRYERYQVPRPKDLGGEHWDCISTEIDRLNRSLEADDDSQVLSDLKCLVEAVARITLDIAGEPAVANASFDSTVSRAHALLADQPGYALVRGGEFAKLASQASKMARNLGNIRNEFGGGHGRSRSPRLRDEMVDLALDGGLTWVRWAVRRLGLFSMGRLDLLIKDLIEEPATFHSGDLRRRLEAANLAARKTHHQQELGVAVGQRVMRGTFVVRWDGLDPCLTSDDLDVWPVGYRIGLLHGLWFDPNGHLTLTPQSIEWGLTVLDPVPDCAQPLSDLVDQVVECTDEDLPAWDESWLSDTLQWLRQRAAQRPEPEGKVLLKLAGHLTPPSRP